MDLEKLIKIQKEISSKVIIKEFKKEIKTILSFDVSFKGDDGWGCGIVFDDKMNILKEEFIFKKASFPYIPTFLAFRELEFIKDLYEKLNIKPDIVLIDGQGIAHPRKCGIATHFGVLYQIPTIGVAKSHLYGRYEMPENKRFAYTYIYDEKNSIIGACLVTKENKKPIFISPGNIIDTDSAVSIIKRFITKYRIPEPLRIVHIQSNKYRKCNKNHIDFKSSS